MPIPIRQAMIAWNPLATELYPHNGDGRIKIIKWPDLDGEVDRFKFDCTGGAAHTEWHTCKDTDVLLAMLMCSIWNIVCRDGITIEAAHEALMVIPEYMDNISADFRIHKVHQKGVS